jgi:hypothetical protein
MRELNKIEIEQVTGAEQSNGWEPASTKEQSNGWDVKPIDDSEDASTKEQSNGW